MSIAGSLCWASVAAAQEGPGTDAVVVTGTRTERPTLDVPASIDRLYADEIRFGKAQVNLSETLIRVPGIVVQNRQNYAQDLQISSRGFGTRSTFGVRGLRLIADGIPASMPDGQGQASTFALGSAERIEVLRGPLAVMYGNASGGVINIVTENGPPEPTVWGDLAFGSYDTSRWAMKAGGESGAVNGIADYSQFRTDGYRDHSDAFRRQLNAKLRVALSESSGLTLVVNSLDQPDSQDPLGLTRAQMQANPRQVTPQALAFNTRKSVGQNQAGATFSHRFDGGGSLQATGFVGHRDVVQYLGFTGNAPATASGGVVDLDRGYGGGGLRYTHPFALLDRPLTLVVGAEYERMAERRRGFDNNNGVQGALRRDEDDTVSSTGGYAQLEWRFASEWIALAGVRVSRIRFDSKDFFIAPGNPDDSGATSFSNTSPAAGLVFRITPDVSWYANYGRGFETPTFAELAYRPDGSSGLNFALNASRSQQYETGLKARIANRARVNLAVFDIETKDEIVVAANVGGRTTFKNATRTRRTGLELGADAALGAGFEAYAAWTLLDAKFRETFTSGAATVPAGNRLPGVPRTYVYGELRWRHAASGFTAALEVVHKGRVAVNDANAEFADAYTVGNAVLGFVQEGKRWRVREFVRIDNLTDRKYVGSVIVNEGNSRFYEPSPERNWLVGVQASLSF